MSSIVYEAFKEDIDEARNEGREKGREEARREYEEWKREVVLDLLMRNGSVMWP